MLQTPKDNPHATLLTLFTNAIPEVQLSEGDTPAALAKQRRCYEQAAKFIGMLSTDSYVSSPLLAQVLEGASHFRDFDADFEV